MRRWRYGLGAAGVLLIAFGVVRLVLSAPGQLPAILLWMVAAVVIHDGVVSPVIVVVGWGLARTVPARARRSVQATLIAGGMLTLIALPMIHREGTEPPQKALLTQSYGRNLAVLLGVVVAVNLLGYAVTTRRDRRRAAKTVTQ